MISPTLDAVRTSLHILSVCVWVGGQITLAGLVPTLRSGAPELLPAIARAFARVAWPAMAFVVITGLWGLLVVDPAAQSGPWIVTLAFKMALVAISIISTLAHSNAQSRVVMAASGALGLVGALAAMVCGVLLVHGG